MKKIKIGSKLGKIGYLIKKSVYFAWHRHHFLIPPKAMKKYIKSFFVVLKRGGSTSNLFMNQKAYIKWFNEQNKIDNYEKLQYKPLFSIIIPTYNVSRKLLTECIESVLNQSYDNFEICICDDNSTLEETIQTLKTYESNPKIKIKYRSENGMISKSSNDAIKMATGEFIVLLDNDDLIEKDALYYLALKLNEDKDIDIDMIYTDEDKMDFKGNIMEPHFKPDFSPDTLMSVNYICHLSCIRKSIVDSLGGFRSEYDGSQDYDLFLRVTEKTSKIAHVRKVLYHWRQTKTSTAGYMGNKSYAYVAGKKALEDALKRRGIRGEVLENPHVSTYIIKYHHDNPLVSIVIPIKDNAKMTKRCIDSIYNKCDYKNFEIVLVDNNSELKETFDMIKEYQKKPNFKSIRLECEFNYSYINNEAVKHANGDYVLFLNNDTEVIDPEFMDYMVGYASLPHAGCVGIKLLYPDKLVQHAGVVLGYGGVAGHIYVTASNNDNGLFGRLCMPYDYTAVTAACLMIKKTIFESVNGFDEKLKVALNDVDLNLKVLSKGYYNICLSNITMFHYESKSRGYEASKEKYNRFLSEQNYMKDKWQDELKEDKFFSKNNF